MTKSPGNLSSKFALANTAKRFYKSLVTPRDVHLPRVAVIVAASMMFGIMLAVWLRTLDAITGRTVYGLACFDFFVMLGLVAGYTISTRFFRTGQNSARVLCYCFLLIAFWLVVLLAASEGIISGWTRVLNDLSKSFSHYLIALIKTASFLCLIPSLSAGVAIHAALAGTLRSPTRQHGHALTLTLLLLVLPITFGYGLSTTGLIPKVGVESLLRFAALWFGGLATSIIFKNLWSTAPFIFITVCLFVLEPPSAASILTQGIFGRLVHRDSGFAHGQPVLTRDSQHHTVAIYEDPDYQRIMTLDGRPVILGTRFNTARTLTGLIPLLLRPTAQKVAVFGPEAGIYLPFFVRGGVANIKYAGSDKAVVNMASTLDQLLTGAKADVVPKTIQHNATLSRRNAYDLIILSAEPAWMRGTSPAYSASLFKHCRRTLREDGLVALHLDARALSQQRFASIARAFLQTYPSVQLWCTGPYDWLLIGSVKPLRVSADQMLALFDKPAVAHDFVRAGVLSLPEVLANFVCDRKELSLWLKNITKESAWQSAWRAPRLAFSEREALRLQPVNFKTHQQRNLGWLVPNTMDEDLYIAIRVKTEQYIDARVAAGTALAAIAKGAREAGLSAARAATIKNPRDTLLNCLADTIDLEGRRRIVIGDFKGALSCYENLLLFTPASARTHYGLGYCLRATGAHEAAYQHFARAVYNAPEQLGYRIELAQIALMTSRFIEADRQFQEILARDPDHVDALFRYAKGLANKERKDRNLPQAIRLAERACTLTAWQNKEYANGLADLYLDAGRLGEGMGLKRRLKADAKLGLTHP